MAAAAAYKLPEDVNVSEYVSLKLSGTNYSEWKTMMMKLIQSCGLTDFITDGGGSLIDKNWERIDEILKRWIEATVDKNILASIVGLKTCRAMWELLERNFSQPAFSLRAFLTGVVFIGRFGNVICPELVASSPSALYPYPSDINVVDFVPIKLTDTNYFVWKAMMLRLISSQGLLDFVSGDWKPEKDQMSQWRKSDELVKRWIIQTLSDEIVILVMRLKTAKQIWTLLYQNFSQLEEDEEELVSATHPEMENLESRHLPLLKAIIKDDWEKASSIFEQEPGAIRAIITMRLETPLMVAVSSHRRNHFVKRLVDIMSPEDVVQYNGLGSTALHTAAYEGNTDASRLIVEKNSLSPNIIDRRNNLPLHLAALSRSRKTVIYLLSVTNEKVEPKPFELELGVKLVRNLIVSGLYDVALSVVQRYPNLASADASCLKSFAQKHSAFKSGAHLNIWQRLVYTSIPVKVENIEIQDTDQNAVNQKLRGPFWEVAAVTVPQVKRMRDLKLRHSQALQLLKLLLAAVAKLEYSEGFKLIEEPLKLAADAGINEVVEEIFDLFPSAIYVKNESNQTIFQVAVLKRRVGVFNLIYQVDDLNHKFFSAPDVSMNTGLHLAGCLEPRQKTELRASAPGAALQMQRELQWFKEVENLTPTQDQQKWNSEGKTGAMVFTEAHQDLVKEGEQWMKDTSNSCIFVASLIFTMVFAAAITVPGGNNGDTGLPFFMREPNFIVFAISNALALFSSTSSVLMFLSILNSRYAEHDFLYALPTRLIVGLVMLFLSLLSMIIAFGATLDIMFGDTKPWLLIPVVAFAFIPVALFVSLQFPLLVAMIVSTYRPGIFGKQSQRVLF